MRPHGSRKSPIEVNMNVTDSLKLVLIATQRLGSKVPDVRYNDADLLEIPFLYVVRVSTILLHFDDCIMCSATGCGGVRLGNRGRGVEVRSMGGAKLAECERAVLKRLGRCFRRVATAVPARVQLTLTTW